MGITERREREKERRRNEILDAAEKVFFSKGINGATMDDVAETAELSKGTLYLYFQNKRDLYLGISMRALELLLRHFQQAVVRHDNGMEKMRAIGEAYIDYVKRYPDYFNTIIQYESEEILNIRDDDFTSACHRLGHQVMEVLADAIRTGMEDGTIRSDIDPLRIAFLLQGQSNGVIQLIKRESKHLESFEGFDGDDLLDDYFRFTYNALVPDKQRGEAQ